ncbi:MAG: hypothetical protein JSR81_15445 [Proteobacteria bacterium]|nr:hypothetical protein [Pseudomonadota bacterium]
MAAAASEAAIAARWRFVPEGAPFETHSSWLRYGARDGVPALLKIYKPGSDEAVGARFLRLHEGCGVARVLESADDAALLERALPGTALDTLCAQGRDDEATHILCDIVERLQSARVSTEGWPAVAAKTAGFARYQPTGGSFRAGASGRLKHHTSPPPCGEGIKKELRIARRVFSLTSRWSNRWLPDKSATRTA